MMLRYAPAEANPTVYTIPLFCSKILRTPCTALLSGYGLVQMRSVLKLSAICEREPKQTFTTRPMKPTGSLIV